MSTSMVSQTIKSLKGNWEFLLFYVIIIITITMTILTLDHNSNLSNDWSSIAILLFISVDMFSHMIFNEILVVNKDKENELTNYIKTLAIPIVWIVLTLCLLVSIANYLL